MFLNKIHPALDVKDLGYNSKACTSRSAMELNSPKVPVTVEECERAFVIAMQHFYREWINATVALAFTQKIS